MENCDVTTKIGFGYSGSQVLGLINSDDVELLCPIEYIHNYLPLPIKWLKSQPISLSRLFASSGECKPAFIDHEVEERHSIRLDTKAAKMPLHTGLESFRQNRYWRANEQATKELLELFAQDGRCSEVILRDKRSMASLFEDQLKSATMNDYSRFSVYMFPKADETRIRLLGQSVVLIFAFDDMWESASPKMIENFREDFVSRLRGSKTTSTSDTPLERRLSAIRQGLLAGTEEEGNGGAEVLQTLVDFCYHAHPPREEFGSARDYLDYRWDDIANGFTWACSKFSIRSSVNQHHPTLHRILRLLGDHISIVNDIASYEKEKRRFESGGATAMINLVHVIVQVERVEALTAKSMAYAWQLCTEDEILRELEGLKGRGELRAEEWSFVDACLLAASGNLFTSVVMSRYCGEDARILGR